MKRMKKYRTANDQSHAWVVVASDIAVPAKFLEIWLQHHLDFNFILNMMLDIGILICNLTSARHLPNSNRHRSLFVEADYTRSGHYSEPLSTRSSLHVAVC